VVVGARDQQRRHRRPEHPISAHNPFSTVEEFERLLCDWLEPEGGPNDAAMKIKYAHGPIGWWKYCVKGLSRVDAKERRIRAVYQGEIEGKRSGMTQNISRAARQRWLQPLAATPMETPVVVDRKQAA
jgi:hypothetical protein